MLFGDEITVICKSENCDIHYLNQCLTAVFCFSKAITPRVKCFGPYISEEMN